MVKISDLRPPVVTDIDRWWAIDQCPSWACVRDIVWDEISDDGDWLEIETVEVRDDMPNWTMFVAEQVERFEKFFADTGELKTRGDLSRLWRKSWWPKAHPERRFPRSAPREFQPFFRVGTPEFDRALKVAKASERKIWKQFGVAQFKPDDPRVSKVAQRPESRD